MNKQLMRLPKFRLNRQTFMKMSAFIVLDYDEKPTERKYKKHYNKHLAMSLLDEKRLKNDYWRKHREHLRITRNVAELEGKDN